MANKTHHHAKIPSINLVPRDPFYEAPLGKTMLWSLKVGRYIIVFTEIIVIISFASRFKLDKDLTDLNQSINQKTAIISSYADTEKRVRAIQQQSTLIAKLINQNAPLTRTQLLMQNIPQDVKLSRLSYQTGVLQLSGTAKSSQNFSQFVTTLQHVNAFKTIVVDKITSGDKQDSDWAFDMRISFGDPAIPTTTVDTSQPSNTAL